MATHDDIALEEEFAQSTVKGSLARRLFSYTRPYRRAFYLNVGLTILSTVMALAGPKVIQYAIDQYLTGVSDSAAAARGVGWVSMLYLGTLLAGWGLAAAQVRASITAGQGAMNDLRADVFEHIQRLSLNYFDKIHQGRIIARADTDIDSLDRVLTWGASQALSSLLTLIGVLVLMLRYDAPLCLAVALVLLPLAWITAWFHKTGREAYRRLRGVMSRLVAAMAENISGVRVVHAFNRGDENLRRFQVLQDDFTARWVRSARVYHTYMPAVNLLFGVAMTTVLAYGGWRVSEGRLTVGGLAAFTLYLGQFFGPVQMMGDLYNAVLSAAASAERIFGLLDTAPQVQDRAGADALPALRGEVVFDRVKFRYDTTPEGRWVLDEVSFEALPGELVALVGHTGSGKTTIISLLARFYEAQEGRILIDGLEPRLHTMESLRRQTGIVTQENFLFTGTVMENLKFGRPEATDDDAIAAAKRIGSHAFIERMPEGYQTRVGDRGASLSAGERQLVTITRAMIATPRLLILDEATSAVDPATEQIIQKGMAELFVGRTCFVIAHRLSTVRHATQILVLDHGKIVERGRHDELVKAGGVYARLHEEFTRT
jgi:ABC-type multidrug transport system fused ATPase/permease subunit